ncbi:MAG: diaminopimelate epimerase [Proteobacteria bacterium]|jgi:diaminopimelate epimerase|nr:diaminopimelate epimerase [Pseudomonadota bacterium]
MVKIPFTKMHGIGNDFIIINQIDVDYHLSKKIIHQLANRRTGIGFDQMLIIEKSSLEHADFKYRIFNADGSEVAQCGNGARCFFRFIHYHGLSAKKNIVVETKAGILALFDKDNGMIGVDMGEPIFNHEKIPYQQNSQNDLNLLFNNQKYIFDVISMGNPHAVIKVDDFANINITEISKNLQTSNAFPESVNVGFLKIKNKKEIRLKVYERGSGLTLACGSGACAAAVIAIQNDWVDNPVKVVMDGGELEIFWKNKQSVVMVGPAQIVYEGLIELND